MIATFSNLKSDFGNLLSFILAEMQLEYPPKQESIAIKIFLFFLTK